ncbi:hypothetical protein [Arthrobacter agilis]|uniref:hypothetical protein n=1 Tax=Arthrobacter agilis TaxID=37921 RepID=UPI00278B48CD|nr:hypothetical protein [Arthrobacter agilis]MDQ0734050.1 hypothetical protein [Arthrobacter agilis]
MTSSVTVAVPFVRVDASQNPNIRSKKGDAASAYFRAMTVAFASVRRLHPDFKLELITNAEIPTDFEPGLLTLGVQVKIVPFSHRPPSGFSRVFEGSLFLLDALDHLNADTTILIDPDVLLVRSMTSMLRDLGDAVGAVHIDYGSAQEVNGLTAVQVKELHALLGEPLTVPQQHMGGEFYVIPRCCAGVIRQRAESAWNLSLDRYRRGEARFTTEEHVLNFALRGVPLVKINAYVRRIWTAHSFRDVAESDMKLLAWHLPAEKDRGFGALYPIVVDRESWFWHASEEEFVSKAAKVMGLNRRGPVRLGLDALGPIARKLRERRLPISMRAAG